MLMLATALAACMWLGLLVVPWRPWSTREQIAPSSIPSTDLSDVTVVIPARDEASCIARTLLAIEQQGSLASIIVVDDQSTDGTRQSVLALGLKNVEIVDGTPPPASWTGKLWALEQGLQKVTTPYVLLLDADIELAPGILAALKTHTLAHQLDLASVMAELHMNTLWEKLLLPPFVFFFKLIYPFALSNSSNRRIAAAAGGCILVKHSVVLEIGGFSALRDAIIDDCALAALVKRNGGRTWIGLSRAVRAIRPYDGLCGIWNMVARTAFTQLRYSVILLCLCTILLLVGFVQPIVAVFSDDTTVALLGAASLLAIAAAYLPTIRYYRLNLWWVATLPVAACLFLAMTWTSAKRYWSGERSRWKNRSYARVLPP
jgi:hopene-associated glycosyltransferase HpnB